MKMSVLAILLAASIAHAGEDQGELQNVPCVREYQDHIAKASGYAFSSKTYTSDQCLKAKELIAEVEADAVQGMAKVRAYLAATKRPPVRYGMTTKEYRDEGHYQPAKINTTQTARTTLEQWVLRWPTGSTSYLYFTNGKLTGMQD